MLIPLVFITDCTLFRRTWMMTRVSWHCNKNRKHFLIPYVVCLAWGQRTYLYLNCLVHLTTWHDGFFCRSTHFYDQVQEYLNLNLQLPLNPYSKTQCHNDAPQMTSMGETRHTRPFYTEPFAKVDTHSSQVQYTCTTVISTSSSAYILIHLNVRCVSTNFTCSMSFTMLTLSPWWKVTEQPRELSWPDRL